MTTRRIADAWLDALSRLERWAGDVAVCWAEAPDRDGAWRVLGITVRGGILVADLEYRYAHLRLRSRTPSASTELIGAVAQPSSLDSHRFIT